MDTIIVGILLSFAISVISPLVEANLGYDTEKSKMIIILGISLVLAIVTYVTPAQYIQTATEILGTATATYWILWKLVFKKDYVEEQTKFLMK